MPVRVLPVPFLAASCQYKSFRRVSKPCGRLLILFVRWS